EDDHALRVALRDLLGMSGHEVAATGSAEDAMAILDADASERIGVVVTDINLPSASGVDLLGHTRRTRPSVEVVLMSGEPTLESASAALKLGAHDYLFKPFASDEVLRVVAAAAARALQ